MSDSIAPVDFKAPASLYKWPSFANDRQTHLVPYFIKQGSLADCIEAFLNKPEKARHLYEIHTKPQQATVTAILAPEQIVELSRFRDFLS